MAHWAEVDENNIVVRVVVTSNDQVDEGESFVKNVLGGTWIKTSINTSGGVHYTDGAPSEDQSKALRFNYAGVGYRYDPQKDAFIPPRPFDSWNLDEESLTWKAPVPYPEDGMAYFWDEAAGEWVLLPY